MKENRWYTEEELQEAKAYLRDRLRNERSMTADVERLLVMYAAYLLTALFNNLPEEQVERIIVELVTQLLADCELLAVDEHDRRDTILAYIHTERGGDTLTGRIEKRVRTYYDEILATYIAGRLLGKRYDEVLNVVTSSLNNPWHNTIIEEAKEKIQKGIVAGDVSRFEEPHYGRGVDISSKKAIEKITDFAIGDAWMYWGWLDARDKGAKGYFVERGSSYPCDECQSHVGIFYPIEDEENRPQYHRNCCCYVVYSYVERYA